jgi:hypothetical protein
MSLESPEPGELPTWQARHGLPPDMRLMLVALLVVAFGAVLAFWPGWPFGVSQVLVAGVLWILAVLALVLGLAAMGERHGPT